MSSDAEPRICPCPHCGGLIEFPPELAGAGVDCPHCGLPVNLVEPEPEPESEPELESATRDVDAREAFREGVGGREEGQGPTASDIAKAFRGVLPRASPTLAYRVALLAVTLTMLILPLVYLAIVVGVGWGVWEFAMGWFQWARGFTGGIRLTGLVLMLYIMGLFVGGFMLLFLVKPLFARRRPESPSLALNPAAEPLLFAFVHMIADAVGAPRPARIDVDCRLNASAGFRRGWISLAGHDFVLSLGLPLIASFDARQLAGVVAHELAHFKQGWGLRASYLVRAIGRWLARVAYERDSWDDAVADYAESSGSGVGQILVGVARLGVWFSRGLLILLFHAGHAVSCLLLRELERDADRCQVAVGGSAAFEAALLHLPVLSEVARESYRQMRANWQLRRPLPDNLPRAIARAALAVDEAKRERWIQRALAREPGLFDTHPTDAVRLNLAREAAAPGLFDLDLPATALFSNFGVLGHQATVLHYEDDLGLSRSEVTWDRG